MRPESAARQTHAAALFRGSRVIAEQPEQLAPGTLSVAIERSLPDLTLIPHRSGHVCIERPRITIQPYYIAVPDFPQRTTREALRSHVNGSRHRSGST